MYDNYTPWVMGTYGDSAKTKTITTRKYARIVALLRSLEKDGSGGGGGDGGGSAAATTTTAGGSTSEAAKFRLWVKSKGFHLGPPAGHPDCEKPGSSELLYLPTGTDKVSVNTTTREPHIVILLSFSLSIPSILVVTLMCPNS